MIKTVLIRTIGSLAVAGAIALLTACEPYPWPEQAIPPGPSPNEVADYATAQIHFRQGLATGDGDAVASANEAFRQIPRAILFRENPKLVDAKLVCERNRIAGATTMAAPFGLQCRNIEWRYNEATTAIRHDLEARITAADYATIRQAAYP